MIKSQTKLNRKSLVKSITTITFGVILSLTILLFSPFFSLMGKASASYSQGSVESDSAFMYAPISSASFADGTTISLDQKTSTLITIRNNKIVQDTAGSTYVGSATNIYSLGQNLVLISTNDTNPETKIRALDYQTRQVKTTSFAGSNVALAQSFDNISVHKIDNTLYVVMYKSDFSSGLLYFSISSNQTGIEVSNLRTISISTTFLQQNFSDVKSLNISFDRTSSLPYALVHSGTNLFCFYIYDATDTITSVTAPISNFNVPTNSRIYTIEFVGENYILVQRGSSLEFYEYTMNRDQLLFDIAETMAGSTTVDLSYIDGIDLTGSKLTLSSKQDQMVLFTTISENQSGITLSTPTYATNPDISLQYLDQRYISFHEVVSNTNVELKASPYAKTSVIEIVPGSRLVHIANGYMSYDGVARQKVNGYEYFLITINGVNYYGFLEIDKVSEIDITQSTARYVYARPRSKVYKYPTRTPDTTNIVIGEIDKTQRLELVNDVTVYSYTVGSNQEVVRFYQVEVNGNVGYIETTQVDIYPEIIYVQTNAVVLRTSAIYDIYNEEKTEAVICSLSEAKRVRIIENRSGHEKYTKICFNDVDGNYYEGYILSENIKADSWTTLQLIGFTLVIFSVILLGVILIVKNKVTKS